MLRNFNKHAALLEMSEWLLTWSMQLYFKRIQKWFIGSFDHDSVLGIPETSFLLLPEQSKDLSVGVYRSRQKSMSDLPLTFTPTSPPLPPPPHHHHTHPQTSKSDILLARQSSGNSLSVVTIHAKSYQCHFFFSVGPFNARSPPNWSNIKYLHTLVSGHPICVHGQLDCISSQSPFTRSIWAGIWVRKIEANTKSRTYYSSVTV